MRESGDHQSPSERQPACICGWKIRAFLADTCEHSIAAAEILQAISKRANDRFNALAASIVPFVFVAKHDDHDQVKGPFQETWEDNVGGSRAVALYLKEIISMAEEHLDSRQWAVKHTSARAIAGAATAVTTMSGDMDATNAAILWPALEKALAGKTWDGKEVVLYAFVKFVETSQIFWSTRTDVAQAIEKVRRLLAAHVAPPLLSQPRVYAV